MGLSRNKVAVSEGAAGSPPFYGEHGRGTLLRVRSYRNSKWIPKRVMRYLVLRGQSELVLSKVEVELLGVGAMPFAKLDWAYSSVG